MQQKLFLLLFVTNYSLKSKDIIGGKMKYLSKQKEPIGERKLLAYRPESVIFKKLETISKKEGISMNQTIDKFIKRGITTGLSF